MVTYSESMTCEQVCRAIEQRQLLISPSKRVKLGPDGQPLKTPDGKNVLEYNKHKSGTQKYLCSVPTSLNENVDASFPGVRLNPSTGKYQWFAAVAEAVAKDIEANGKPDSQKVTVFSVVSQDGKEGVLTLHYQGNTDAAILYNMDA